jgi:hypothetical protein
MLIATFQCAQVANLVGYVVGPSEIKILISKMLGKDCELQISHPSLL